MLDSMKSGYILAIALILLGGIATMSLKGDVIGKHNVLTAAMQ